MPYPKSEPWDQYVALGILLLVILFVAMQGQVEMFIVGIILLSSVTTILAMYMLNKGRKQTVNLKTDISYIGLIVGVLLPLAIVIIKLGDPILAVIILLVMGTLIYWLYL